VLEVVVVMKKKKKRLKVKNNDFMPCHKNVVNGNKNYT
jgi:hypothetical protein